MKKAIYIAVLMMLPVMFIKAQTAVPEKKITITKLIAYEKENRLFIEWAASGGSEINYWQVQSSTDGKRFSTVALVLGPDPSGTGEYFAFKEKMNKKSAPYYRIVFVNTAGEQVVSEIIKPSENSSFGSSAGEGSMQVQ